jgi:hypothetical protein
MRNDNPGETQLLRLQDTLLNTVDRTDLSGPAIQTPGSMLISKLEERIELITAKSIAGSFTFKPPAIFRKTSFWINLKPALFSNTANNIFIRRKSNPVALRCGVP